MQLNTSLLWVPGLADPGSQPIGPQTENVTLV